MAAPVSTNEEAAWITVQTSRFGPVTVDPARIITMVSPFLGFPDSRRFFLRPHSEKSPFLWLQSLDRPELAFVTIQPAIILPEYRPEIPEVVRQELEMEPGARPDLLVILTIPAGRPREMTANLLGPVALNVERRLGKQVLLDPGRYDPCWPVLGPGGE